MSTLEIECRDPQCVLTREVGQHFHIYERPPREAYVRASGKVSGLDVCAGLEMRDGDDFAALHERVVAQMLGVDALLTGCTAAEIARQLEVQFQYVWPDRAYFLEVGDGDESKGWVQVYQPFGMPRSR